MAPLQPDFIDVVAADRDLVVGRADSHHCRLEPRHADALEWHCVLDDGSSNDSERDPAAYVSWVCPPLRLMRGATGPAVADLGVSRAGPQSDLGSLLTGLGRLAGRRRRPRADTEAETDERYVYTDPSGVLDDALRHRIENWPSAMHGDGVMRPVELGSIRRTGEGLVVSSSRGGAARRRWITRSAWPSMWRVA